VFKVNKLKATDSAGKRCIPHPLSPGRIGPLHSYLGITPDDQTYTVLLNQFCGEVEATTTSIRNSAGTTQLAHSKFSAFFQVAKENDVDLAVCPEYSCPWESLISIVHSDYLPSNGKLWILGMESIKPNELLQIIEANTNIHWHFDSELLNADHNKVFLDPACFISSSYLSLANELSTKS